MTGAFIRVSPTYVPGGYGAIAGYRVSLWTGHPLLGQLWSEVYPTKYKAEKVAKQIKQLGHIRKNPTSDKTLHFLHTKFKVGKIIAEHIGKRKAIVIEPPDIRGEMVVRYLSKSVPETVHMNWFLTVKEHKRLFPHLWQ